MLVQKVSTQVWSSGTGEVLINVGTDQPGPFGVTPTSQTSTVHDIFLVDVAADELRASTQKHGLVLGATLSRLGILG